MYDSLIEKFKRDKNKCRIKALAYFTRKQKEWKPNAQLSRAIAARLEYS